MNEEMHDKPSIKAATETIPVLPLVMISPLTNAAVARHRQGIGNSFYGELEGLSRKFEHRCHVLESLLAKIEAKLYGSYSSDTYQEIARLLKLAKS